MSAWLTHNPFSSKVSLPQLSIAYGPWVICDDVIFQLDRDEFKEKLAEEQSRLRQLVGEGEEPGAVGEEEEGGKDALKQAAVVSYFTDALQFVDAVQDCVPTATRLLGSKVMSDVLESLEFLCVAKQFGLRRASEGLRKAVVLVWSKDENIKKALISTYIKIYFTFEPKVHVHVMYVLLVSVDVMVRSLCWM